MSEVMGAWSTCIHVWVIVGLKKKKKTLYVWILQSPCMLYMFLTASQNRNVPIQREF